MVLEGELIKDKIVLFDIILYKKVLIYETFENRLDILLNKIDKELELANTNGEIFLYNKKYIRVKNIKDQIKDIIKMFKET